ncbi:hypothetical protein [Streptomyces misionensis]|uniref:hypothetical protein n=1 Tax=Streptomyces misionensis TaxID=67331 RepID=UPI0033B8D0DB
MSGAAATPRVDVEPVLLCDVLPDGSVAATVLVEPVYDTSSGARVGTRIVDPATGTTYTPTGTLIACGGAADECARQIKVRARCDDTTGDGTGDTTYTEVWALDPCDGGAPNLLGTYRDGDYALPYTPVAPVNCPETATDTPVVLGTVCYDAGGGTVRTAAVLKCAGCADTSVTYLDTETGATLTAPALVPCVDPATAVAGVETWPLCVLNTDGSVLQYVRAEQVYDAHGAPSGPPRIVDAVTGGPVAIPGGATLGMCPGGAPCASPTQPTATVGLCLPDGTPIAVTVVRDCAGTVTSEGWINLRTGAFSAGAPPTGTVACGSSQSVQVSGTFCDLDPAGAVLGLVLIEYSYAADGTISGVRLVDATTGTTYTPQGEISVCPAGTDSEPEADIVQLCDVQPDGTAISMIRDYRRDELGAVSGHSDYTLDGAPYQPTGTVSTCQPASEPPQPERDLAVLCDTAADGTVTSFVRDYERDLAGAVTGHTDYALDGTAYTPAGTVGVCEPEPCASTVTTLRLCDLNPDVSPDAAGRRCAVPFLRHLVQDCTGALVETRDTAMDGTTGYTPVKVVDCGSGDVPAQVELVWPQTGVAEDPAGVAQHDFIYSLTNPDTGATAEVRLHASTAAGGSCGPYNPAAPVFNNPTVYTLTLDAAAQEMTVFRLDLQDFDTFEGISGLTPVPDRVEGDVTWNGSTITANQNNLTAYVYWDHPPATISWRYGNTGGGTACSVVAFQGTTLKAEGCCGCEPEQQEPCARQVVERCGCDDTNGDGTGDTQYTELWAIDPCNGHAPVLLGTYEDGDLTKPYTPVAPVECTTAELPPGPLSTGVRAVTGTAPQDLAAAFPGLQSVSLTVTAGTVNATMSDGSAVPIPAGVTMTWSVAQDTDTALAVASFAGATASASCLLNWTYK